MDGSMITLQSIDIPQQRRFGLVTCRRIVPSLSTPDIAIYRKSTATNEATALDRPPNPTFDNHTIRVDGPT